MNHLDKLLESQQKYFATTLINSKVNDRIAKIRKVLSWVKKNKDHIVNTCLKDYIKPVPEFYSTEINPILNHIEFTLRKLKAWTRPKTVWTPISLLGTKSKIYYEPKGVCLIVSPWNYPFNLTLNPLISAIAAGNCVIVKPSEYTPNTSKMLRELISYIFTDKEVALVEGGSDVGDYLINLKFDHIFFTGSPDVGKIVMSAAANNLTSITLELGGKNHTIIDKSANMMDAAEKILWSKYVNCGQTCIAVNHVFVHEDVYGNFIECLKDVANKFFEQNLGYTSVVNKTHFNRLEKILQNSLEDGAQVLYTSPSMMSQKNHFPLTILDNVEIENSILKNEIFGPILPLVRYKSFDDLLTFIQNGDKSLAMYLFSKSKFQINKFLHSTSSGTVAINECMLQYANPHLLFGGVNHSGVGKVGRKRGFLAFSNEKSVLFQWSGFSIAKFIYPPYTSFKHKIAKFLR